MRVLIVTGSFPPMRCGVGDYSYHLARALAADAEVHVGVLTNVFDGARDEIAGVEVFPVIKDWSLAEVPIVRKIIRQWAPDIVHIQYPTQGYYGKGLLPWALPLISFAMGKTVVQTWHEGYCLRNAPELFFKSVVSGGLVLVRPRYKEKLRRLLRWAFWKKKTVLIPIASNIPTRKTDEQKIDGVRRKYLHGQKRLIVFFGFVFPRKGVELLFDISDPASDQIVIAGELGEAGGYYQEILRRSSVEPWLGKATITGFLPSADVADLLAVADAVILPFRNGGGEGNNGSVKAAVGHGVFTITTSLARNGYDKEHNVYYAKVDDVEEMKAALGAYAGKRRMVDADHYENEWREIAGRHISFYKNLLSE